MTFTLHSQLAKDCIILGDLKHCRVLLMNNRHFPWLILVPRVENARELFDLTQEHYHAVMLEVRETSQQFAALTKADKMNIASLGNMVPQLHIHIIARYAHDAAWPQPVWNHATKAEPYDTVTLKEWVKNISKNIALVPC